MEMKNNVSLDAMEKMGSAMRQDPAKGKRTQRVEGTWNLSPGRPQFSAEIPFEGGKLTLEADQPSFLGGGGTRPGPIQYALFGTVSCFAATFASTASQEGLELHELRTAVEADLDFSKVFGIADLPVVEEVRVSFSVKSQASREALQRVLKLAEDRCPASWCLQNPVRVVATLA